MTISITRNGLTVTAETQQELFEELARHQEIFSIDTCGRCESQNIRYVVREVDENKFFEMRCSDCNAKLSFGQHKGKGQTLFPHRKDSEGNWLPHGGWKKWNPETKREE
jgi:hypothetical protein